MRTGIILSLATAALLLAPTAPAAAHEVGAIHVASSKVAADGSIVVNGDKLPKNSPLKLELRGILDNYPVGQVTTDAKGVFQGTYPVPAGVPVGSYTLVAIASDGDVTARADLAITAAAGTSGSQTAGSGSGSMATMPGMNEHGSMPGMSDAHAIATPMPIQVATTTGQWAIILSVIVLSFAGGAVLIRRRA